MIDHVKCFTHGRIKKKYRNVIENPKSNIMEYPDKSREYFTSVGMDSFNDRNCLLLVR